jgi:hypothetical protein
LLVVGCWLLVVGRQRSLFGVQRLMFGIWRLAFDVPHSPFDVPPFPPHEQLLTAVVGWAVSDENEMKKEKEKDTYSPRDIIDISWAPVPLSFHP